MGDEEEGSHAVFCVTEEVLSAVLGALRHLDLRRGGAYPSERLSENLI